jgi:folate-binding protein YgfZ
VAAADTIELDGQYRLLREEAGVIDRSDRGMLEVSGPEATDYLQGQVTNDVEALVPPTSDALGTGCYAALLDRKGHMQADMRIQRLAEDRFWIDTEPGPAEVVHRHLDRYRIGREVAVGDFAAERTILSIVGPEARERLAEGLGLSTTAIPVGPEHAHAEFAVAGISYRLIATDAGVDVVCARESESALRARLAAAGLSDVSVEAGEILRVEGGRPRFGFEMTAATIPEEAGINERAVSFTKGCYIGQETVARLHYKGKPNRHLRGIRLQRAVASRDPVILGGRDIGNVGTAVLSPGEGPIALAILRREAQPGARVEVGDAVGGEVVDVPFR